MLEFAALAQQCAPTVAVPTLAAIVKTESAFRPYAIGINRGGKLSWQPRSKDEAVVTARWLITNGYNIDMGLGQINSANLKRLGMSVEDVFDECKNLAAAATILSNNFNHTKRLTANSETALHMALSMYNTGHPQRGFRNGYVQRVVANMGQKVAQATPPVGVTPIPLARAGRKAAKPGKLPSMQAKVPYTPPSPQMQEGGAAQQPREDRFIANVYERTSL